MTQTTEETPMNNNVAVELARFSGKLDQVIVDYGRRLTALETDRNTRGSKTAGIWSPIIAAIAVLIALADKVNWS